MPFLETDGALENLQEVAAAGGPGTGIGVNLAVLQDMQAMPVTVAKNDDIKAP